MRNAADIVCLSSIDWDFIWQGHQEIMATFAKQGHRVLFVENTGVRPPNLKDLPRLRQRIRNWRRSTKGFREERPNLFVYSPLILPFPYSRVARWVNRWLLLRALRRWMRAVRFRRPLVWTFLPTPLARDVIRELDPTLTVYYCIDDFASSSRHARKIRRSETALFREADLVFVTSEKLRERAARVTDRVHLFPFGVNFEQFQRVRAQADAVPAELRDLPRPVIGYVGGIHQWVDLELLEHAARSLPQASFVLVGPPQADTSGLRRHPNIHLLGKKPHAELPRYIKGFDVGIVPYRLSDYTANVYPTKLNEYLAMGIPVVTTDLPEIRRFNAEHGDAVSVARDAETFAEALRGSQGAPPEEVRRRIEIARTNGWERRIAAMAELIDASLAARSAAPVRWEESLRLLYRWTRGRMVTAAAALAVAWGLLFYTPALWIAAAPLRIEEAPRRADAIVVFAGGAGESGRPGQGYEERVAWAVELHRRGFAPKLVFSSGFTYTLREPEVMKAVAVSLGVPAEDIILETESTSTRENVMRVREILGRRGWIDVLLVSSPYHMRRASMAWKRLASEVRVTCVPFPESRFYRHGLDAQGRPTWRQANLEQVWGILHEYLGIVYYKIKRWV